MLPRTATVLLAALATVLLGEAGAADPAPGARVEYRDDRLSLDVQSAPLADVIGEVGRQSGAVIRGHVCKPRDLSLSFDDVPLPDALERVLGEQNFTLRYSRGGRLEAVELLGEPGPLLSPAATASGTGSAASSQARGPGGQAGGGGAPTVGQGAPAAGLSVSVLGGTAANGQTSAAGSPVVLGGGQATTAQGQQSSSDQQLSDAELEQRFRKSLLNSLGAMDDASLAAFMDTPEGRRVQGLLQYYADHHVGSNRQQEAAGIIQRLPNAAAPAPTPAPASGSHHAWR